MQILRRFLVIQALMLWQGGFLFYAAFVVPTGSEILGSFEQGRVTRHVTDTMNVIGAVTVAILAWDQFQTSTFRRTRWLLWSVITLCLLLLAVIHPRIESLIDYSANGQFTDYSAFYFWHRTYLMVAAFQWFAGLLYVAATLRAWARTHRSESAP